MAKTTKKAPAKKATSKGIKHFAYAVPGAMNGSTDAPLYQTISVSDPATVKNLEADPTVLSVSKAQADQIDASNEGVSIHDVREDLFREINELRGGINKMNAGDWVYLILVAGISFTAGALIF